MPSRQERRLEAAHQSRNIANRGNEGQPKGAQHGSVTGRLVQSACWLPEGIAHLGVEGFAGGLHLR